uniref:Uncharacterized protein n=1 Tax=Ficus carica TaxID=3494 RepID=A0AA88CWU4_FICCA|nr:hypothetical protein TIFTF001_051048 [Ficus carica]GMN20647.1 hypothetical protein TIFTF001_051050 [Ficus carica]
MKEAFYATYEFVVHPIGSAEGKNVSEEVRSQVANPPKTKRGLGRPRVTRILSQGDKPETIRCSKWTQPANLYNQVPLRTGPTTRSHRSLTTQSTVM